MNKAAAFNEVFTNKPKTVDRSKSATGQRKQIIAIALSKAGLSKPGKNAKRMHLGGTVPADGQYALQAGEKVIPAPNAPRPKGDSNSMTIENPKPVPPRYSLPNGHKPAEETT